MGTGGLPCLGRASASWHKRGTQQASRNSQENVGVRWKPRQKMCIWVFSLFAPVLPPFLLHHACSVVGGPKPLPVLVPFHSHSLVLSAPMEGLRCLAPLHQ